MLSYRWLIASAFLGLFLTSCSAEKSEDDIYKLVEPSIVLITYEDQPGNGTGFFVSGEKNVCTVLTARHVTAPSSKLQLQTRDLKIWKTSNIRRFPKHDLALVTFDAGGEACPYKPLELGDSGNVKIGKTVHIVGFPGEDGSGKLNKQFVSSKVSSMENIIEGYAISYTAVTTGGMSGSPVLDTTGKVVAVHGRAGKEVAKLKALKSGGVIQQDRSVLGVEITNFKWAIPINTYVANLPHLPAGHITSFSTPGESSLPNKEEPPKFFSIRSILEVVDIEITDWSFQAMQSLFEKHKIVQLYSDKTFRPNQAITKAEFVDLLATSLDRLYQLRTAASCRSIKLTVPTVMPPLDLEPTAWYYRSYKTLTEATGYNFSEPDGTFSHNNALKRSQMVVGLNRMLDSFADSTKISSRYGNPSSSSFDYSLVTSNRQRPSLISFQISNNQLLTQVTSVSQFSDVNQNDWFFNDLRSLVEKYGIIEGEPDRKFRPDRAVTRAETAVALNTSLDRMIDLIVSDCNKTRKASS